MFVRDLDSEGYVLCVCNCPLGEWWKKKWQLKAFVATLNPAPLAVGRLEEFFTPAEVAKLEIVEGWHPSPAHPRGK